MLGDDLPVSRDAREQTFAKSDFWKFRSQFLSFLEHKKYQTMSETAHKHHFSIWNVLKTKKIHSRDRKFMKICSKNPILQTSDLTSSLFFFQRFWFPLFLSEKLVRKMSLGRKLRTNHSFTTSVHQEVEEGLPLPKFEVHSRPLGVTPSTSHDLLGTTSQD